MLKNKMEKMKSLIILVLSIFTLVCIIYANSTCYFACYEGMHEVYLSSPSSNAEIISTSKEGVKNFISKRGEAVFVKGDDSLVNEILERFNAKLVFVEKTDDRVCYYAYSREIRYSTVVGGERVNLHLAIGKGGVKIGAPIIFGSF